MPAGRTPCGRSALWALVLAVAAAGTAAASEFGDFFHVPPRDRAPFSLSVIQAVQVHDKLEVKVRFDGREKFDSDLVPWERQPISVRRFAFATEQEAALYVSAYREYLAGRRKYRDVPHLNFIGQDGSSTAMAGVISFTFDAYCSGEDYFVVLEVNSRGGMRAVTDPIRIRSQRAPPLTLAVTGPGRIAATAAQAEFGVTASGGKGGEIESLSWFFRYKRGDQWVWLDDTVVVSGVQPLTIRRESIPQNLEGWFRLALAHGQTSDSGERFLDMDCQAQAYGGGMKIAESPWTAFRVTASYAQVEVRATLEFRAVPLSARVKVTGAAGQPLGGRLVKLRLYPFRKPAIETSRPLGAVLILAQVPKLRMPNQPDHCTRVLGDIEAERNLAGLEVLKVGPGGDPVDGVRTDSAGLAEFGLCSIPRAALSRFGSDCMVTPDPAELAALLAAGKTCHVEGDATVYGDRPDGDSESLAVASATLELDRLAEVLDVSWSGTGPKEKWTGELSVKRRGHEAATLRAHALSPETARLNQGDEVFLTERDRIVIQWFEGTAIGVQLKPGAETTSVTIGLHDLGKWRELRAKLKKPIVGFTMSGAGMLCKPVSIGKFILTSIIDISGVFDPVILDPRSIIVVDYGPESTVFTLEGQVTVRRNDEAMPVEVPAGMKVAMGPGGVGQVTGFRPVELPDGAGGFVQAVQEAVGRGEQRGPGASGTDGFSGDPGSRAWRWLLPLLSVAALVAVAERVSRTLSGSP